MPLKTRGAMPRLLQQAGAEAFPNGANLAQVQLHASRCAILVRRHWDVLPWSFAAGLGDQAPPNKTRHAFAQHSGHFIQGLPGLCRNRSRRTEVEHLSRVCANANIGHFGVISVLKPDVVWLRPRQEHVQ